MADLIIVEDQLTFPWRDRARVCPKCQGRGGTEWHRKTHKGMPPMSSKIPCILCRGAGELMVDEREPE